MRKSSLVRGTMILAVSLMPWAVASASILTSGSDGENPNAGSGAGSTFNPTFECTVAPGDSLDDLLDCLADNYVNPPSLPCGISTPDAPDSIGGEEYPFPSDLQQNPPGDDDCYVPQSPLGFDVERLSPSPPRFGLSIVKDDGSETERLWFWENDPVIQMTAVEVNRPGLVGRIAAFVEHPSRGGGIVTVWVNDFPVEVDTSLFKKASELTRELMLKLKDARFDAMIIDGAVVVLRDRLTGAGITSVRFQSEDPAIKSSNLAVVPLDELLSLELLNIGSR